jgi:hypothetical protein
MPAREQISRDECVLMRSANLCHTVIYANILRLYTDQIHGKIRMGCQDILQTNKPMWSQTSCSLALQDGAVGGYASSYSSKLEDNTIVMCKIFFAPGQQLLLPLIQELRSNRAYQKDPTQMMGKTRMLLHELTHLAAMSETPVSKRTLHLPLLS